MSSSEAVLDVTDVVVEYLKPSVRVDTLKELLIRKLKGGITNQVHKALAGVTFSINKGDILGLIGPNGSGKSTLLKVIAGVITPTAGKVQHIGRIASMIELGAGFDSELTGRENVYLSCSLQGLTRKEIDAQIDEIEEFADIGDFFEAPVKTYSSGMYMRLGFAASTITNPDILLVDEILAVGDQNFQRKCVERMNTLKENGTTVVLVSHDLDTIRRNCNKVVVLENGLVRYFGECEEGADLYHQIQEERYFQSLPKHVQDEVIRIKKLEHQEQQAVDEAGRLGNGKARIRSVTVEPLDGKKDLSPKSPWKVSFEVDVKEKLSDPIVIGFALATQDNRRILGGNNKIFSGGDQKSSMKLMEVGSHKVEYHFDSMGLATGQYRVIAAIHNWNLEEGLDVFPIQKTFDVHDDGDVNNFDKDLVSPFSILRKVVLH